MYEQPSLHMELARLRHRDFEVEADRARLAAEAKRTPSEALTLLKSVVAGLSNAVSRRRPAVVQAARLQPAV
jgi:hypothetical protein